MSKERCLKIAARAGISKSVAISLLSMRDQTALKDFKKYNSVNPFFKPLLAFCVGVLEQDNSMDQFPLLRDLTATLLNKHLIA